MLRLTRALGEGLRMLQVKGCGVAALNSSIVHLTMRFNEQELSIGTGFLYEREGQMYIITAWHNVTGRNADSLDLLSRFGATPNNLVVGLALGCTTGMSLRVSIEVPLVAEEKSLFFIHPRGFPKVDVVAIPLDTSAPHRMLGSIHDGRQVDIPMYLVGERGSGFTTRLYPVQEFVLRRADVTRNWFAGVDVTDELFIPGYPKNVQDTFGQPVWKRATIASSVQLGWNHMPKFLVDSASRSGMSGAPVFYYNTSGCIQIQGYSFQSMAPVAILAGVYVGRIGNGDNPAGDDGLDAAAGHPSDLDAQLGIVWRTDVIDEIINARQYERLPECILEPPGVVEAAVRDHLARCPRATVGHIRNPRATTRYYARSTIQEALNGRAAPRNVLETLLHVVEGYDGPFAPDDPPATPASQG